MKTFYAILTLMINLSFASFAMAAHGGMEGGGGVGVLCKNGASETLQLLDVWETKNVYNFGTPKDYGSIDRNLNEWYCDWDKAQGSSRPCDYAFYNIEKTITGLFTPVSKLSLSGDFSRWRTLPENCQYIQIAKFIDPPNGTKLDELWAKSKLQIVMPLYKKLDDVNKAALLLHEFNYFAERMLSNWRTLRLGSDEARIIVAAQTTGNSKLVAPIAPASVVCDFMTADANNEFIHHFYAQDEMDGGVHGVRLYFGWINGYVFPLKATTFVPGLTEADLQLGSLSAPIDILVSYDMQLSSVTLRSFKIRLEKSGNSLHPLKITPLDVNGNLITNGECL